MPISEQKRMLVPVGSLPAQKRAQVLPALLVASVRIVGRVCGKVYELCFGWADRPLAIRRQQRFQEEIRMHLGFLFDEYAAQVIPNKGVPFPPGSTRRLSPWRLTRSSCDSVVDAASSLSELLQNILRRSGWISSWLRTVSLSGAQTPGVVLIVSRILIGYCGLA
jgi:hypothetical protein